MATESIQGCRELAAKAERVLRVASAALDRVQDGPGAGDLAAFSVAVAVAEAAVSEARAALEELLRE